MDEYEDVQYTTPEDTCDKYVSDLLVHTKTAARTLSDIYEILLDMARRKLSYADLYNIRELLSQIVHLRDIDMTLAQIDAYLDGVD